MDPDLRDLLSAWRGGDLDEPRRAELLEKLRHDEAFRHRFVEEIRLLGALKALQSTEPRWLLLEDELGWMADERAAASLREERIGSLPELMEKGSDEPARYPGPRAIAWRFFRGVLNGRLVSATVATGILLLILACGWWWLLKGHRAEQSPARPEAVAWLVNAQDCQWEVGIEPAGDLFPGKRLQLKWGLAELSFRSGARVVLEGPAVLELVSDNSVQVLHGRLTARVPAGAEGFTVLSPEGRIIDHGTAFGVSVGDNGKTEVRVFEGKVEAILATQAKKSVHLEKDQAAILDERGIVLEPEGAPANINPFVRAIVPPPVLVPRTLTLDFRQPVDATIGDAAGRGTGLTCRLPGTGQALPAMDPNLTLDSGQGQLELSPTHSDLNKQIGLEQGEYLGVRLADLGFREEDFAVTASIPHIPILEPRVGQFGLYAGSRCDKNIRGGLISRRWGKYSEFLVHNNGGPDSDLYLDGLLSTGDDLRLTLKRTAGKYALTVENQTTGSASTLAIRPAEFLDGERDLYVGLFGASAEWAKAAALVVKDFKVTVWTKAR